MKASAGKVLIIVQNLPVPLDRRVWLEATTLREHDYHVSVISPMSREYPAAFERIAGISIYRYPIPFEANGFFGYCGEFIYAWLQTARLSLRVLRREGFDVIQACNPPDTYFLLAMIYKLFGKKFIFDHHDLSPEMFSAKFAGRKGILFRALLLLERMTLRTADLVMATNESYKKIAIDRGRKRPEDVYVLRTGPDLRRLQPVAPEPALRRGRRYLACYLGEMCPQDGVDYLLHAIHHLREQMGRKETTFAIIGGGPAVPDLKRLTRQLGLEEAVHFTGRISDEEVSRYLSTADLCVDPDPWSEWANNSTMNKILEYMVFAKPIVAFDLKEIHYSARRAALYARPNDIRQFALKIAALIDDPELRLSMGLYGRTRVLNELAWIHTHPPLLEAYARIFDQPEPAPQRWEAATVVAMSLKKLELKEMGHNAKVAH